MPIEIGEIGSRQQSKVSSRLSRMGEAVNKFARSTWAVILVFSAIYFVPTLWIAAHKLLWDDEFFTLYLSAAPGWHEIIRALSTGADQHPPSFYYLTHLVFQVFGTTHITVRLPEMLAYWSMCVLLYFMVKRLLGDLWGILAMALPLAFGGAYYYASEARGYSLLLAFSTLALFCWTRATEDFRRRSWLCLLAAGLAGAVASHYYAVLVALALGLAELHRSFLRRKIDWPIWAAFCGTFVPLLIFMPVIRSSQGYSGHFWAHPRWRMMFDFHPHMLGDFPNVLLVASAVTLWWTSARRQQEKFEGVPHRLPPWVVSAVISFALIPCFAMLLAKGITHGYVDRYAIPGVIGACILCTYLLYRVSNNRGVVALISIAMCLVTYGVNAYVASDDNRETLEDLRDDRYFLVHRTADLPLVVDEVTIFHRLSFYGPPQLTRRLAYIADADASVKYLGQDTIDRGLLALRPWFPINVVPMLEYAKSHSSFLVYGYVGDWTWVTYDLGKPDVDTRLLARRNGRLLLSVGDSAAMLPDTDNDEIVDTTPSLYSKFESRTQSLCAIYMGSSNCPSI